MLLLALALDAAPPDSTALPDIITGPGEVLRATIAGQGPAIVLIPARPAGTAS